MFYLCFIRVYLILIKRIKRYIYGCENDLGGGKPTLLIAEDEESNYLLLKTILHKYCNLIRAKTGLEALALFKENEVDLILMDIKMPEMTGIESLKEIRKLSKDIPVIMQSAYVFDSDMEAAKEAGASGFITKPINLKVLKIRYRSIVRRSYGKDLLRCFRFV